MCVCVYTVSHTIPEKRDSMAVEDDFSINTNILTYVTPPFLPTDRGYHVYYILLVILLYTHTYHSLYAIARLEYIPRQWRRRERERDGDGQGNRRENDERVGSNTARLECTNMLKDQEKSAAGEAGEAGET